jgi:hypothetical protein
MQTATIQEYIVCNTACFVATSINLLITVTGTGSAWDLSTPSQYTIVRLA